MSVVRFEKPLTGQDNTPPAPRSRELLSPRGAGLDPHREHREFPARWQRYLLACHGDCPATIARTFGVSVRAARKWLAGDTGCKGAPVSIAVQLHPDEAPAILFAAE